MKNAVNLLFLSIIIILNGCAISPFIGPIAQGITTWKEGEAEKVYNNNSKVIYRATKKALQELNISIKTDIDYNNGNYKINAGNGDRFIVEITNVNNNITKIMIRVNFMGDKDYAELIYKEVDKSLYNLEF